MKRQLSKGILTQERIKHHYLIKVVYVGSIFSCYASKSFTERK